MRGQVTQNYVLIRLHIEKEVEKKTQSGIILPSGLDADDAKKMRVYKEHPFQGDVIQVGERVTLCKPGDRVYINGGMQDLIEDGVYYSILRDGDIIYVITKEEVDKLRMEEMATEQLGKTGVILN